MIAGPILDLECPVVTAGDIAVINLESSLNRAWNVLRRWPDRPGTAERIVEEEQQRAQFLGDVTALDRLANLSSELCEHTPRSADTHLIAAQIASMRHHFADAKAHLAHAETRGADPTISARLKLTIQQASGENLDAVLAARQQIAASRALQDLVPLGALLADLGEFEGADRTYETAIRHYRHVSPFALAWVCFQRGFLWGETVPEPDLEMAGYWYKEAISYLPGYTHARVHLAEIHLEAGELEAAESLLLPIVDSGDPEVRWRLSQVLAVQGRGGDAALQLALARAAFESLLARHELAFADHAAEFYLSSGGDPKRACDLAQLNLANRPTLRAFELAYVAAIRSGEEGFASELLPRARTKFASTNGFAHSLLARPTSSPVPRGNGRD